MPLGRCDRGLAENKPVAVIPVTVGVVGAIRQGSDDPMYRRLHLPLSKLPPSGGSSSLLTEYLAVQGFQPRPYV